MLSEGENSAFRSLGLRGGHREVIVRQFLGILSDGKVDEAIKAELIRQLALKVRVVRERFPTRVNPTSK